MPIGGNQQPPPSPQQNPFTPPQPNPLVFEDFQGVNTSTTRAGVPDQQAYWLDGFMPLDKRNLRTLYGVGSTLYTAAGTTVVWYGFANIGTTPYMIVFLANGQVVGVNTSNGVATTILTAATITSPTILNTGLSQWGRQYIVIVADQANGYWLWDGTTVFTAGTLSPEVDIVNAGSGYIAPVTVVASGGHGHGASLTGSVFGGNIQSISVVSPGTGYSVNDVVTAIVSPAPVGGSGGSITASVSNGTLVSLSIVSGGSLYNTPSLVISGLHVMGMAALAIVSAGTIVNTSITNVGVNAGAVGATVSIVDTVATATINLQLMPFGVQGSWAETYQGRVWVGSKATVYFTAPGSFADFSTASGGGNFTSYDSFLQNSWVRGVNTNGFLYLIGDSSTNYISGVNTTGSPPATTFTNQNADPEIGTPYPQGVLRVGQNILLANSLGVHLLTGAKITKVSEMLDGVWNSVANLGGLQLSTSKANIFGRKVWMVLNNIVDPVSGTTANKVLLWDGKRWWASLQDINLTFMAAQEINSVFTSYGTNGTIIAPLFSTASTGFTKTLQTRLWDEPGGYQLSKATNRFWSLWNYYSASSPNLVVLIDAIGISNSGQFANQQGYTITGPGGTGYFLTPPQAVGQQGALTGFTIQTTAADAALVSAMIEDAMTWYRG